LTILEQNGIISNVLIQFRYKLGGFMDDGGSPTTGMKKLSNRLMKLFGVDTDDVTEEEIISMVNEGHEQGVLQAGGVTVEQMTQGVESADIDDVLQRQASAGLGGNQRGTRDRVTRKGGEVACGKNGAQ
jgi:hypothetical protein